MAEKHRARSLKQPPAISERMKSTFRTVSLIREIEKGYPFEDLERMRLLLDISRTELASYLKINARTWARRKQTGRLTPEESERVYRFRRLFSMVKEMLRDDEKARQWFKSPKVALGGKSPLEYGVTEIGAREVEDLIGRTRHGVFA